MTITLSVAKKIVTKRVIIDIITTQIKRGTMTGINRIGTNKDYGVFTDITKPFIKQNNLYLKSPILKEDKVEISSKTKPVKNKKLLIGGIIACAALIGIIAFRKNISNILTKNKDTVNNVENNSIKQIKEKFNNIDIENARKFLIDDVKTTGEIGASGVCFYGPDSKGKEQIFEGFIQELKDAGYKIERAPREKESTIENINNTIAKLIKEAETRYKNTKERTAIIVRDLDKIAPDREIDAINNASAALLGTEKCREKGFTWISEAVDYTKIDTAIRRPGRIDQDIIVKPLFEDSEATWKSYINMIKKFREGLKKDTLLKEAEDILKVKLGQ